MRAMAELSVADWHRLNRLLETALALEGDARSAWLRNVPPPDADLLPLLEQLLSAQNLTETAEFVAAPRLVSAEQHAAEEAGQLIGPYRLLRELGQGGMGTVWLAERADGAFERQVALKLPHAEWIDRGLAQRFARERAVLASLNHPNIAQLFDAGWSEAGRPYLALEYVDGEPIHQSCNQRQLDTRARLSLFVAVIRAVAHAHARLVVHRDLKPSNVLVTAAGEVKLLDFGIAKLLTGDSRTAEETELTRLAGRALTLSYAAPEQILGQPISTAADTYALGVLLFELLTGERPYRLGRADARGSALEEAIVRVEPPAPSAVARDKTVRHTLRGDLDAIVLKALKKAPEQRYETAAAFADDIERYLAQLPVHAQRDSRAYRLRRFLVRNRFAVGAGSAVLVALAIGLSVALWQARVARDEATRATMIKDFVLSIIQQADPVASRQTKEADVALLTTAEARIERELERQPELALQMRRAIGAAYRNRGEFQRASQVLRKGIEQARVALPPDNLELLGAMVQIADQWVVDNRRQATADLETAITHLRALGPGAQVLLADALFVRYRLTSWTAPWKEGVERGRDAYRAAGATSDEGRMLAAAADQVQFYLITGIELKEAVSMIAEAVEYATRRGRIEPADPRWIIAVAWHGAALCATGQQAEGLKLAEGSVAAARKFHGADSNVTEEALGAFGFMLQRCMRDPKRAVDPMREAYAISVKRESPESENRAFRQTMLTGVLFELDLHDEVERLLRETPPVAFSAAGLQTAPAVFRLSEEANTRLRLGETEKAEEIAEEAVRLMEAEQSFVVAERLYNVLARALQWNGKLERAEKFALAALEHEDQYRPATAERRAYKLMLLCRIRFALGHYQSALDLADQALGLHSKKGAPTVDELADGQFQRGRALLGLGRPGDAVEALSISHAHSPDALVSYYYGRALVANGESARGRALIDAAAPELAASRNPLVRALVKDHPRTWK